MTLGRVWQWLALKATDGFRQAQMDYWIDGKPRSVSKPRWDLWDAIAARIANQPRMDTNKRQVFVSIRGLIFGARVTFGSQFVVRLELCLEVPHQTRLS